MKYQLLWAACFVGLLQLSAVASRSTVDEEIINKENAKYSTTTVGPTVAYTGQEVERGVNSSDKLAVDPGVVSSYTQSYRFDWILVFVLICSVCFILSLLILGCIAVYYWHKKVVPGMILNRNNQVHANLPQHPVQFSAAPLHRPTNASAQQKSVTCQKCHQQYPLEAQLQPLYQLTEHQQKDNYPEKVPSTVNEVHQVPQRLQAPATVAPALQSQTQEQPTVIEFENPVSDINLPE